MANKTGSSDETNGSVQDKTIVDNAENAPDEAARGNVQNIRITETSVTEIQFLSCSQAERLTDLADRVLPELIEAGLLRGREQAAPPPEPEPVRRARDPWWTALIGLAKSIVDWLKAVFS